MDDTLVKMNSTLFIDQCEVNFHMYEENKLMNSRRNLEEDCFQSLSSSRSFCYYFLLRLLKNCSLFFLPSLFFVSLSWFSIKFCFTFKLLSVTTISVIAVTTLLLVNEKKKNPLQWSFLPLLYR